MAIPEQPFGFVAGRWVLSLADTPMDSDRAPDYKPLYPGSVIFNNKLSHRVVTDGSETVGIVKTRYEAKLNEDGRLIDAEEHEFVALPLGVYSVTFSFGQYSWPNFDIEVKSEHTIDSPLWLPSKSPVPAGPGVVHVVKEEDRVRAEAAALLAEGFSDSAEASALAASLASSERGVRVDNSVGTRILLDHPGGTTMLHGDTGWRRIPVTSIQIPALTEMFIQRTTHHVHAAIYANNSFTAGEVEVIAVLPPGFRPNAYHTRGRVPFNQINAYYPDSAYPTHTVVLRETGEVRLRMEGQNRLHATLTTYAEAAWPDALPGQPV